MQTKFIYIEDDTAVLFAANGTPLLAVMGSFADIVPLQKFAMPVQSMWFYLFGLVFIFSSKIIIQLFNDDMRQRERLQNGRDILMEAMARDDLSDAVRQQIDGNWDRLESLSNTTLLKEGTAMRLSRWRAYCFFLSGLCFLISSFILILAASSALSK